MHDYTIETERLILRPLKIDDAEAVYQWVSDERVAKYMVYNTYTSLEAVVEWRMVSTDGLSMFSVLHMMK